jgi:hypothetical protein
MRTDEHQTNQPKTDDGTQHAVDSSYIRHRSDLLELDDYIGNLDVPPWGVCD